MEFDDEGNIVDPISLDIISEDRVILFKQNGITFCFDIEYLSRYVNNADYINPMNRQPLDKDTIDLINVYILKRTRYIPVYVNSRIRSYIHICMWNSINDIIVKLMSLPRYVGCKVHIIEHECSIVDKANPIENRNISIILVESEIDTNPCAVV